MNIMYYYMYSYKLVLLETDMKDIINKIKKQASLLTRGRILYTLLVSVGSIMIITAVWNVVSGQREYKRAQTEYEQIRTLHNEAPVPPVPQTVSTTAATEHITESPEPVREQPEPTLELPEPIIESSEPDNTKGTSPVVSLVERNPDYIGWISIKGTTIDYPVVRGSDNQHYLKTSFSGQKNSSGAIFMDFRCEQNFDGPVSIVYGHNMKNGSMFAPLHKYLDAAFMEAYPEIVVTTLDGETLIYRIYDARETTVWDMDYSLNVTDSGAGRLLFLSTCVSGSEEDVRLLVSSELSVKS